MDLTFKRYTYTSFDAGQVGEIVEWDSYPTDWQEQATIAGFDPDDDELGMGTLQQEWNGHPAGALVVSGLTTAGYPFAVSNEAQGA